MARPKIHGERVEWKLRIPKGLAESIDKRAAELGRNRTDLVVAILSGLTVEPSVTGPALIAKGQQVALENRSPETPDTSTPKPIPGDKNCPHKYRVQRGGVSLCPACGDTV